jgi:hypothetical protein
VLRKRKKYKLTSPVWEHASKCIIDNVEHIKCHRCGKVYAWHGSSTNMLDHLVSQHEIAVE